MEQELTCQFCGNEFREDNLPRLLAICGHTFCESCLDTMIVECDEEFKMICPQDGKVVMIKTNDVKNFPENISLVKLMQQKNNQGNFKDQSFNMSKIVIKVEPLEQDEDKELELLTVIKGATKDNSKFKQKKNVSKEEEPATQNSRGTNSGNSVDTSNEAGSEQQEQNICLLHQKVLDVVCMVDLERICAKCAIFGQHKGHDFRSIDQIEAESNNYHEDLLRIYSLKQGVTKKITNEQTKKEILSLLSVKKTKLQKEISQKFKKITAKLKSIEEVTNLKLEQAMNRTSFKLKRMLELDPNILQQYDRWEKESYKNMMIIEGGTFEEKLDLLFRSRPEDMIDRGTEVVAKLQLKEETLMDDVQMTLESVTFECNDDVERMLDEFAVVKQNRDYRLEFNGYYSSAGRQSRSSQGAMHNTSGTISQNSIQIRSNTSVNQVVFVEPVLPVSTNRKSIIQNQQSLLETDRVVKNTFCSPDRMSNSIDRLSKVKSEQFDKPTRKKLKSIKVPEKFERVLDMLFNDALEVLDLTNAELGDNIIAQICQFLRCSKVKTVKFIRNKITDEGVDRIIPSLSTVISCNLSQNQLSEQTLNTFIQRRQSMPLLKSLILSQNRIIERKHKPLIDYLRKMDLTVSV